MFQKLKKVCGITKVYDKKFIWDFVQKVKNIRNILKQNQYVFLHNALLLNIKITQNFSKVV